MAREQGSFLDRLSAEVACEIKSAKAKSNADPILTASSVYRGDNSYFGQPLVVPPRDVVQLREERIPMGGPVTVGELSGSSLYNAPGAQTETPEIEIPSENKKRTGIDAYPLLTPRELDVIAQVALGMGNKEVAKALFITDRTVKFFMGEIFEKLDVKSRTAAAIVHMKWNRLAPEEQERIKHEAIKDNGTVDALTPKEHEIALLIGEGLSNKEVAKRLSMSEGTAKFHLSNIFDKLGVTNRTELAVKVFQQSTSDPS